MKIFRKNWNNSAAKTKNSDAYTKTSSGYFRYGDLDFKSEFTATHSSGVSAVADVFTALTEDRPYRKDMDTKNSMAVLHSMSDNGELDNNLVDMVFMHYEAFNKIRISAQQEAIYEYNTFKTSTAM